MSSSSEPPRRPFQDDPHQAAAPDTPDDPVRPDGPTVVLPPRPDASEAPPAEPEEVRPDGPTVVFRPGLPRPEPTAPARLEPTDLARLESTDLARSGPPDAARPEPVDLARPGSADAERSESADVARSGPADAVRPELADVARPGHADVARPGSAEMDTPEPAGFVRPDGPTVVLPPTQQPAQANSADPASEPEALLPDESVRTDGTRDGFSQVGGLPPAALSRNGSSREDGPPVAGAPREQRVHVEQSPAEHPRAEVPRVDGPEALVPPAGAQVEVPEQARPAQGEFLRADEAEEDSGPLAWIEFSRPLAPSETELELPTRTLETAATLAAIAVIIAAVPAAVLVLPDTSANVVEVAGRSLGIGPDGFGGLMRATSLSVPVLLGAVPVGAVLARRFGARPMLVAGVVLLIAGLVGVWRADTVPLVGAVRALQGVGAGLILPASLVLAWERGGRLATSVWSGVLVASLIGAMPVALSRVPLPDGAPPPEHPADWHAALAPFPWCAAAFAGVLPLCMILRGHRDRLPALRHTERGQLVLPLAPAVGFAFIAVVTTYGWSPGGRLVLAGLALLGLAGLAFVGSRDATAGSPLGAAVVLVTTGLLAYPVAAPLAGIAAVAARDGDGASYRTYLPFAAGGAAALVAAVIAARLPRHAARVAVLAGHALIVLATLPALFAAAVHLPDSAHFAVVATVSMVALGAGAGLALAMSLREAGVAAALFGLALCFPAVLTGQLVVLSLQAGWLRPAPTSAAAQLAALTGGYRAWLGTAAVLTVLLAAAGRAAAPGRARTAANRSRASASVQ